MHSTSMGHMRCVVLCALVDEFQFASSPATCPISDEVCSQVGNQEVSDLHEECVEFRCEALEKDRSASGAPQGHHPRGFRVCPRSAPASDASQSDNESV